VLSPHGSVCHETVSALNHGTTLMFNASLTRQRGVEDSKRGCQKDPSRVGLSTDGWIHKRALLRQVGFSCENLMHFVLECPRYGGFREDWVDAWPVSVDSPWRRVPILVAALGESAQFFESTDQSERETYQAARRLALHRMWVDRCSVLAVRLSSSSSLPSPRVSSL
jgi:hypothetical protein